MQDLPDYAQLANLPLIEGLYARYQIDPESVDSSWRHFFEGFDVSKSGTIGEQAGCPALRVFELVQAYRRYGHLQVPINPIATSPRSTKELELKNLGFSDEELNQSFPTLGFCKTAQAPLSEIIAALSDIYCSRIGFETMDLGNPELEQWVQQRIEPRLVIEPTLEEKHRILSALNQSEIFETFLQMKYVGQKRFSIEGVETAIPVLAELIEEGAQLGADEFFLGMAHRGRLNVLCNLLNKPYSLIFREFEDTFYPLSTEGSGDVKYHKGFSSELLSRAKQPISLHLAANPSHLESVDPIVLGQTRARQIQRNEQERVCAILIHGDAALAGQGVIYESLQLFKLPGYSIGGTLHLVLNNQIGFTTLPDEAYSTRYCTDIAKTFNAPVLHVNAEDPESCFFVAKMAMQLRERFHCDVFIDLNGYRKYGHNEGDEPFFTQPLQYQLIRKKVPIREIYAKELFTQGQLEQSMAKEMEEKFKTTLNQALSLAKEESSKPLLPEEAFGVFWKETAPHPGATLFDPVETCVDARELQLIADKSSIIPNDFHLHPKLQKWLEERKSMMVSGQIDWGLGESLAYGSLLLEGVHVRLAGQDSRRGTFSHRHVMWIDQENAHRYFPLAHLKEGQARFDVLNSPLSEYAAMGFEYGYSWAYPQALVLWEAQFGDFFNGAQIIIDQYISSAEQKWFRYSPIVLLLPHGYEGQGPEHSSARLERFLQLCANENMQIVNASTPVQFFHVLRRQAKRALKKPLIIFTPKSLLRAPQCVSPLSAFSQGSFEEILDDPVAKADAKQLLLCSGHVYYDLLQERERRKRTDCAIIRIEQLYPLHVKLLKKLFAKYNAASRFVWVQEEPQNMGAWEYLHLLLQEFLPAKELLRYAGRGRSASPATGSHRRHEEELRTLLDEAFK